MKRCFPFQLLLLFCAVLIADWARAEEGIGLVLGGGGARGAAHVGVLRVLEREHIPVRQIAGTSVGSFIGALYAIGYDADQIEAILLAIDWRDMFSDDPPRASLPMRRKDEDLRFLLDFKPGIRDGRIVFPRGVLQGQKLLLLLRRLTLPVWQVERFDQLPIPYRAIATDLGSGAGVVFDHGDLALAVRASMSVPAAYAPVRIDDRLLVDGGLYNNLPIDVVQGMGAEHLVAVDVGDNLVDAAELSSPLAVSNQMVTILMRERTKQQIALLGTGDVLIKPDLGNIGAAGFDRVIEGVARGEAAAMAVIDRLRAFAVSAERYAEIRAAQRKPPFDPPLISFLDVIGRDTHSPHAVGDAVATAIGTPLDASQIESSLASAYGQGHYETIQWQPIRRGDATGLELHPVDKSWGPNFLTFGFQLGDDFKGRNDYQLALEATFAGSDRHDGETRLRADLGRIAGVRAERYQPFADHGRLYVLPFLDYRVENQLLDPNASGRDDYRVRRAQTGALLGYNFSNAWRIEGGMVRGANHARLLLDDPGDTRINSDFAAYTFDLTFDSLDDSDFPSSGGRTDLLLQSFSHALGGDGNGQVLRIRSDRAFRHGRDRFLLGLRAHTTFDNADPLQSLESLGGFAQLSGFIERERVGQHSALGRVVYYRRLSDASRLFSLPAYFGATVETGNVWNRRRDVSIDSLVLAGSLFLGLETPFGPMFLSFGQNDSGAGSVYLNFGSLLGIQR